MSVNSNGACTSESQGFEVGAQLTTVRPKRHVSGVQANPLVSKLVDLTVLLLGALWELQVRVVLRQVRWLRFGRHIGGSDDTLGTDDRHRATDLVARALLPDRQTPMPAPHFSGEGRHATKDELEGPGWQPHWHRRRDRSAGAADAQLVAALIDALHQVAPARRLPAVRPRSFSAFDTISWLCVECS